ncbi:putative hemolysin [Constrictibacter sp. MBR-5]|jgi:putative hemolysin|uniref:hypothetical protein n=1 Tax=Constrictibacter sp. MBR-5 TaxID=3156467 RepID=UPI00339B2E47
MRTASALTVALLALAGCSSAPPKALTPTPTGISYIYEGDQLETATDAATRHCASQGRAAQLRHVGKQDGQHVAVFSCD